MRRGVAAQRASPGSVVDNGTRPYVQHDRVQTPQKRDQAPLVAPRNNAEIAEFSGRERNNARMTLAAAHDNAAFLSGRNDREKPNKPTLGNREGEIRTAGRKTENWGEADRDLSRQPDPLQTRAGARSDKEAGRGDPKSPFSPAQLDSSHRRAAAAESNAAFAGGKGERYRQPDRHHERPVSGRANAAVGIGDFRANQQDPRQERAGDVRNSGAMAVNSGGVYLGPELADARHERRPGGSNAVSSRAGADGYCRTEPADGRKALAGSRSDITAIKMQAARVDMKKPLNPAQLDLSHGRAAAAASNAGVAGSRGQAALYSTDRPLSGRAKATGGIVSSSQQDPRQERAGGVRNSGAMAASSGAAAAHLSPGQAYARPERAGAAGRYAAGNHYERPQSGRANAAYGFGDFRSGQQDPSQERAGGVRNSRAMAVGSGAAAAYLSPGQAEARPERAGAEERYATGHYYELPSSDAVGIEDFGSGQQDPREERAGGVRNSGAMAASSCAAGEYLSPGQAYARQERAGAAGSNAIGHYYERPSSGRAIAAYGIGDFRSGQQDPRQERAGGVRNSRAMAVGSSAKGAYLSPGQADARPERAGAAGSNAESSRARAEPYIRTGQPAARYAQAGAACGITSGAMVGADEYSATGQPNLLSERAGPAAIGAGKAPERFAARDGVSTIAQRRSGSTGQFVTNDSDSAAKGVHAKRDTPPDNWKDKISTGDLPPALLQALSDLLAQVLQSPLCSLKVQNQLELQRRSLFDETDPGLKQRVLSLTMRHTHDGLDRAMGCLVGMAVADGLGHNFEFVAVQDQPPPHGPKLEDPSSQYPRGRLLRPLNKFQLRHGQWTDDTSMALCMADSLLVRGGYDGANIRVWFWNWWYNGINNAFRLDFERQKGAGGQVLSVGLGGNISKSLQEMTKLTQNRQKIPARFEAQTEDAGNGSIMRLAPMALRYHNSTEDARELAYESSLTTHPGRVAAEACALLAHLLVRALHRKSDDKKTAKLWLDDEVAQYERILKQGELDSAKAKVLRLLAAREPETSLERCWNWRNESLGLVRTLKRRGSQYNGYPVTAEYFGAFSLDGLSMAFHAFYTTSSFNQAIVKVVNMAGDADTTGAICGQLSGAFYGLKAINPPWVDDVRKWSEGEIELRAILLYVAGAGIG